MYYFKSFNNKLQGFNNYQFEVDKIYSMTGDDDWKWYHYAKSVSATLQYYGGQDGIRILVLKCSKINVYNGVII